MRWGTQKTIYNKGQTQQRILGKREQATSEGNQLMIWTHPCCKISADCPGHELLKMTGQHRQHGSRCSTLNSDKEMWNTMSPFYYGGWHTQLVCHLFGRVACLASSRGSWPEYMIGLEWEWSSMILNGARNGFFKSRSIVGFTCSESAPLLLHHEYNSCQRPIIQLHFSKNSHIKHI